VNRLAVPARQWRVGIWVADDEPCERYPLFTRGNVGEVFPHVVSALTGTLIGDDVKRAQQRAFTDMGALLPRDVEGSVPFTGVFGGYLYANASVGRMAMSRMPGIDVASMDEQVFGAADDAPPYRRRKGDRSLVASLRLSLFGMRVLRRPDLSSLDEARRRAVAWMASLPPLDTCGDDELLTFVGTYPRRLGDSMLRLLQASILAGIPRGLLDTALARFDAPPGLANRIVGGTDDVDSAQLALGLWSMGRVVAGDLVLTAAFNGGVGGIGGVGGVAGTALAEPLSRFLHDHGHRGSDEYELASSAWSMDPQPVLAAIDRLRLAPGDRDPVAATERLQAEQRQAEADALALAPRPMRRLLRRAALVSRAGSVSRERAKDILVLENLGARLALHSLMARAAARGGPTDVRRAFCVTAGELRGFVASPSAFASVIDERASLERYLNEREPPMWFDGAIPDPATWRRRGAAAGAPVAGERRGIGVSGGRAGGRSRVVTDPADPRGLEPGEVLVCSITDPSWTPLFLGAVAVVCDTGAVQSHAAIVARELGIPAVLSVPGISAVPDGTWLDVDGDAGTVHVA
jgi:rifampicin phosphotransferase